MSGIQRLLNKPEKRAESPSRRQRFSMYLSGSPNSTANKSRELVDPNSVADFYGLFSDTAKPSSVEEPKVKSLRTKIIAAKSVMVKDDNILWALRCNFSKGDVDCAYSLLCAMTDASEGIIISYDPRVKLLGAINRQAVTCYLDSILFAMFSRLDSFEAMLYNTFEDRAQNRLAFLLRLWVNLLRAGKLVTTDVTKNIQESLVECGWEDAGNVRQQDASEAFTFITEKLKLPLLTLKMDMYHSGKHDDDDHRFINERLLEVALPADDGSDRKGIKLEDCLEEYFNNRIEVRRFLERRSTIDSMRGGDYTLKEKANAIHVETLEVEDDSPATPVSPIPIQLTSSRPGNRSRTASIIQERFVPDNEAKEQKALTNGNTEPKVGRLRKGSIRKEVLMPAWQFFSLIPWYTNNAPSNDAQVAAHFSSKRPIIGLCLKRYSMTSTGRAVRLNTFVDIPIEIGLPHFIQDDQMDDTGPLYGNFKLSLQSIVCHRGISADSGHYISLVRTMPQDPNSVGDSWMRFDDLAAQRITVIDINQALRDETPYLLFYQIVPIDGDPGNLMLGEKPLSYTDSQVPDSGVSGVSGSPEYEKSTTESLPPSGRPSFELPSLNGQRTTTTSGGSGRPSFDLPPLDDHRTTIMTNDKRRPSSISFPESLSIFKSSRSNSPQPARRKSVSISRSLSRGSKRLSTTLANLAGAKGKDDRPMSIIPEPTASAEDVGGTAEDALARLTGEVPAKVTVNETTENDHDRGRSHNRHKNKNRLTKIHAGRLKEEKPDRECTVM